MEKTGTTELTDLNNEALLQDWVNDRVNVLVQVFKQEGEAILNGQLEVLQKVAVIECLHPPFQLLSFPLLDPVHCLSTSNSDMVEKQDAT